MPKLEFKTASIRDMCCCDECTQKRAAAPNPYEGPLNQRAASERQTPNDQQTPEDFAKQWQAERQRELDAEYARHAAAIAVRPAPKLTAAELAPYAAPDSWAAGIKALQLKEAK